MADNRVVWIFLALAVLPMLVSADLDTLIGDNYSPPVVQIGQVIVNQATVEYHGSWRWNDVYHTYTLEDAQAQGYLLQDNLRFNLDNSAENWMGILYLGHVYTVKVERSPSGGTDTIFTVTKDGTPCATQNPGSNGKVIKSLNRLSDVLIDDYKVSCGISFGANWETLAIKTDVIIDKVFFTWPETKKSMLEVEKYINDKNLKSTIQSVQALQDKFQVMDLKDPNSFSQDSKGSMKLYAKTFGLLKSSPGKDNGFVITNGGQILYAAFMKDQFTNEFYVAKPVSQKSIGDYASWNDLKQDAILNWQHLDGKKLSGQKEIVDWLAGGSAIAAGGVGGSYLIGNTGIWAASAALAATPSTATAAIFNAGAAATAASGSMIGTELVGGAIAVTPVGWTILGAAAVIGAGALVYNYTTSDTIGYDNGGLAINTDPQLIQYDQKINFMLVRDPGFAGLAKGQQYLVVEFQNIPKGLSSDLPRIANGLTVYDASRQKVLIQPSEIRIVNNKFYFPYNQLKGQQKEVALKVSIQGYETAWGSISGLDIIGPGDVVTQ